MVARESAWFWVTNAPSVTADRPMRPVIGAGTRVKRTLICALRTAALFCATDGFGLAGLGERIGVILLGDRLHVRQRLVACGSGPGGHGAGPRALQVCSGLGGLRLIDAGIDLVERLALLDDRALAEQTAKDHARHLRTDLGHLVSRDPAGKLLLDRRAALLDDRRSRPWSARRAAATASAFLASPPPQAASSAATAIAAIDFSKWRKRGVGSVFECSPWFAPASFRRPLSISSAFAT